MSYLVTRLERFDVQITRWMASYGVESMRIGLGVVFFWFGVLKFIPDASPAQDLALRTIDTLTFGHIPHQLSLWMLATWECVIGLGLIAGIFLRATLLLQMLGTFTPLVLFPVETFLRIPYAPTLEGQYIIKSIVLITTGLVIGATVRGGRVVADPGDLRQPATGDGR